MTDIAKLKALDPELYEDLLNFETEIYSDMVRKTDLITKIRNLTLKGEKNEARLLFSELIK